MQLFKSTQSTFSLSLLKHFLLMTTGGIALIILLILGSAWRTGNRFVSVIEQFFSAASTTPQIDTPTLIIQQIRGVSELTTAVFTMEAVVPTSQERKFGQLTLGETRLLYIAYGEVRAGIDLTNLETKDIKYQDNIVKIQLPPPEILDSKVDVNRSQVYDYDRGFLSLGPDVAPQLQTLAQRETLEKIVTTACQEGLLEQANDRAKLAITQLLTTAGYEEAQVTPTRVNEKMCGKVESNR